MRGVGARRTDSILPRFLALALLLLCGSAATDAPAQPVVKIDLAEVSTSSGVLLRVHGSEGNGSLGVPVAGGLDTDGDANGARMMGRGCPPRRALASALVSPEVLS